MIHKYTNGNYIVEIDDVTGTKIRTTEEDEFISEYPESIDCSITYKCNGGCDFCLIGDTKILTDIGEVKISEIHKGRLVYSYNKNTSKVELKEVLNTSKRYYKGQMIILDFENGKRLICTPNHKVYTVNRGYIEADKLLPTDDFLEYL